MKKSILSTLAISALIITGCASTETVTEDKTADTAQERTSRKVVTMKSDDDPLICKAKRKSGSRLRQSEVCYRKSEWDRQAELAQEDLRRTTANSSSQGD